MAVVDIPFAVVSEGEVVVEINGGGGGGGCVGRGEGRYNGGV